MHTVYKYPIRIDDLTTLEIPANGQILSFQIQNGVACVWALVDPEQPKVERRFRMAGTGHPIESLDGLRFIGTAQFRDGSLVFHLFEVGDRTPDLIPSR